MSKQNNFIREVNAFARAHVISDQNMKLTLYHEGRSVATLKCSVDEDGVFSLDMLHVPLEANRRRGYAKKLAAIAVWCARRAGYKKVEAISTHLNKPSHGTGRPNSAPLLNRLGFTTYARAQNYNSNTNNNTTEFMHLNLNRNIPGVNAVIRQMNNTR